MPAGLAGGPAAGRLVGPHRGLANDAVDAALLRLPFPGQDDVRIEVLLTEPRRVALPATHPLAARYYARPGIAYRPVTGISPSQAGVAGPPANDTDPVVQDFVRCCLDNKPPQDLKSQSDQK